MINHSPWGPVHQSVEPIEGVFLVSTAEHGGFMFTQGSAEKFLSEAARKLAAYNSGYLCFEEDISSFLVLFDAKAIRHLLLKKGSELSSFTESEQDTYLIKQISESYPEYLIELGIEPAPAPYHRYKLRLAYGEAFKAKSPNLIASYDRSHENLLPNVIGVRSADGQHHLLDLESHNKAFENEDFSICPTLDKVQTVDEASLPSFIDRFQPYAKHLQGVHLKLLKEDSEASQLELDGKHFGARAQFNQALYSAYSELRNHLINILGQSYSVASTAAKNELKDVFSKVHHEFSGCSIFKNEF